MLLMVSSGLWSVTSSFCALIVSIEGRGPQSVVKESLSENSKSIIKVFTNNNVIRNTKLQPTKYYQRGR